MTKKNDQNLLSDILNKGSFTLGNIKHKIKELSTLNKQFQAVLPQAMREHCQVANYRDQKLIISCGSAAWATRIRFMERELLKKLTIHNHLKVESIHCIVQQSTLDNDEEHFWETTPISKQSKAQLKQLADSMDDDELKDALLKFLRRG